MRIVWTARSRLDLNRLHDHLNSVAPEAADAMLVRLSDAPDRLIDFPRIGARLDDYAPREVRRIIVSNCELRYEIVDDTIFIVRVWHCREDRSFAPENGE